MSELMTVKQFAAAAGVSSQRIYQRLDTNLMPFVSVVDGHKMLSAEGLQLFEIQPLEQDLNKPLQTLELLQAENETLKAENAELNSKIKPLEQALEKEREKSAKMTAENAALNEKIKGLVQALAKSNKTIEELEWKVVGTQNALDASNRDRTETQIMLNAKVRALESKITDKEKTIQDLRADKDKLNARLDKAEEERAELIQSNNKLTTALQAAQALHGMDKQQAVIEVRERPAASETRRTTSEPRPAQRHRQQPTKKDSSFLSFIKNKFQRKQ